MNFNRMLENNALAFAAPLNIPDHEGFDCVTVVARLAFEVASDGEVSLAVPQRPIRMAESRQGRGSLRHPSDEVTEKSGTDVLLLGLAHPPAGKRVSQMDVALRIEAAAGAIEKSVRVFGPRVFEQKGRAVAPGKAMPFDQPLPLAYEFALGGIDDSQDPADVHPLNPVGMGHRRDQKSLIGTEAPRIESLVGEEPAGFAPVARHWPLRAERFGTVDDAYFRFRHPVPPTDFDVRFNSDAHPDLWSETPLRGDEPVVVVGATPEQSWSFRLPHYEPRFDLFMQGEEEPTRLSTHLDTMLIDLEDLACRVVELTWRVTVRLPKKTESIEKIRISNAVDVPEALYDPIWKRVREQTSQADATT